MTPPAAATAAGRRVARQPEDDHIITRNPRRAPAPVREPVARPQPRERARPATRPSSRAAAAAAALEASLAPAPARTRRQTTAPVPMPGRPRREGPPSPRIPGSPGPRTRAASAPRLAIRLQPPRLDRIVRGRAWIPVLAVMLVAIVGLRVAVLKLGSSVGSQIQQATMLESSNTTLRARISALSDNGRIEKMAEAYGMHMPNPLDEHFVAAGATSHLRSALGNISAPASSTFLTGLASEQQSDLTATQQGSSLSAVGASTGTATTSGAAGTAASTATASPSTVNASTGTTVGGSLPSSPTSTATSSSTTGSSSGSGMSTATTGTGSSTGLAGSSTGTGSSTGLAGSSTSASVTGSPGASLNNGYTNTDASASGAGAGSVASTGGAGLAG